MSSNDRQPSGSLFVSTYEMPRHLELVLAALERQSSIDFELLICDDGSGAETKEIVDRFIVRAPFPVRHFWQDHQGFRKCRILNEALRNARGETAIFLDGDCIPHRDYVRDHLEQQSEASYCAGRRVELGSWLSATLTPEKVGMGYFDRPNLDLALSVLKGDSEHLQRAFRVPVPALRRWLGMEKVDDLKGCNYSVARKHLIAINGFDEEYEGYGREDTDIEIRLQNLGLKIRSLKGLALQFHVWHPRREFTPSNDSRLDEARKTGRIRCAQGLVKRST